MFNFLMGNTESNNKINFEDVQYAIKQQNYILISTLKDNEQDCLIFNTTPIQQEETIINNIINNCENKNIIIYGKNCNDTSVDIKCKQLKSLGISNIYIYSGGLFEWVLLQDIYSSELFPTRGEMDEILKFKSNNLISLKYLQN